MGGSVPDLHHIGTKASGDLLHTLRHEVAELLSRRSTGFPGAQPVSFARSHVLELQKRDYFVCEKSDGVRCLLYMTNDGDKEVTYLIDRKNDYYWVDGLHFLRLADNHKQGTEPDYTLFHTQTILDGELLFDVGPEGAQALKFFVFDCLVVDGQSLLQRTLDKRLAYFKEKIMRPFRMLQEAYPEDVANLTFVLKEKVFFPSYGIERMFNEVLPSLKHGNDGLIFTCRETPYQTGTDNNILKWKPAEENSIDFKMFLEFPDLADEDKDWDDPEGVWERDFDAVPRVLLHVMHDNNDYRPYGEMYITDADWAKMKQWSIEQDDGLDGEIVECNQDAEGRWRFMRFRSDKPNGNHVSVVHKVLESINDSVDKDELLRASNQMRRHWKDREAKRMEQEKAAHREAMQKKQQQQQQQQHQQQQEAAPVDDGYED